MFDYLEQFKRLPKELREKISSPAAMVVLSELEKKYNLALAATVMKVMVKIVPVRDLSAYFVTEFSLSSEAARNLSSELKERLFLVVAGYLGLKTAPSTNEKTVFEIIKNAQLNFSSSDLSNRARHVVLTYLRGVRSKIDVRDVLERPTNSGGLNLSREESTRLLKTIDEFSARPANDQNNLSITNQTKQAPSSDLQTIINKHEKQAGYDLKKELASGRTPSLLPSPDIKQLQEKTETSISDDKQEIETQKLQESSDISKLVRPLSPDQASIEDLSDSDQLTKQITDDKKKVASVSEVVSKQPSDQADKDASTPAIEVNTPPISETINKQQISTSFAPPKKISFFRRLFTKNTVAISPKMDKSQTSDSQSESVDQSEKDQTNISGKISTPDKSVTPPVVSSAVKNLPPTKPLKISTTQDLSPVKSPEESTTHKTITPTEPATEKTIGKSTSETDRLAPNFINQQSNLFHRAAAGSDFKTKVEDIKVAPKIMGPIEELRYLDLVNFRRLGPPPEEATNKIKAKIKLIEKEGYDRRLAAVAAWRKSPVSRLYITIGQEAVSQGITMREATAARKEKKQDYLSWEEIKAIVALNSSLMF